MKSWMKKLAIKKLALSELKDQVSDIKEQMDDIRFRKPWIRKGEETSPLTFMIIGAGLAWAASAIYKNRTDVAAFCVGCGARLKNSWDQSSLREKAERAMGKMQEKGQEAMASATNNGQEPSY